MQTTLADDPARAAFRDAARAAWRRPERVGVAEFADRHRVIAERSTSQPGRYDWRLTPYIRGPMEAAADPSVARLVVMKREQVGGTELLLNVIERR
jgi:phage terminase large subunit GpA-like protein